MFFAPHALTHLLHPAEDENSYLRQVDPPLRILAAVALAIAVASARRFPTLGLAFGAAVLAVVLARLSPVAILRRLLPLEILLVLVVVLVSWTPRPEAAAGVGAQEFSREGLRLGAAIALKANAIVLALAALLGTMDVTTLGHALAHLRVPRKLAHLLLFSVRYLDVLHREYRRLRAAMKVRSFRPRVDAHTYRAYGYLVGMLLVRSFDRSERVLAAMKCRGFRGQFYMLDHFGFVPRRDLPFCLATIAFGAIFLMLEWP